MNTAIHTVESDAPLARDTDLWEGDLARAEVYLGCGLVAAASEIFEALLVEQERPEARYGLACCAYQRGDLHEAMGQLQYLQSQGGRSADVANDLGVVYYRLGLLAEAREQLELSVDLLPTYVAGWRNLVEVLMVAGDDAASQRCRRRVEELESGCA